MTDTNEARTTPGREPSQSVWDEARDLIKRLEGSSVQRLAVEAGEYKIEIERGVAGQVPMPFVAPHAEAGMPAASGDGAAGGPSAPTGPSVVAPLVGTFYRAPKPGAKPFVEEGDVVDRGQTVAIVEAMKLMNEVGAPAAGKVAAILVQDGEWVEFEQPLMLLEPLDE